MKLDQEPAVVRMAHELKVDVREGPVRGITQFCSRRIRGWIREAGPDSEESGDLLGLVAHKLGLVFEEVWTDFDFESLVARYVGLGEPVFATLRAELDAKTFAVLVERLAAPRKEERYVAVIDCRGSKAHRRFFTKWHEAAHLLTLTRQLELPFHRSRSDRSPTERLMDAIAGEIGFPDEVVRPALQAEFGRPGPLTFAGIESIRQAHFPEASFQATLNACVTRWSRPALLLEIGMGLKKTEQESVHSPQMKLFRRPAPEERLRVLTVVSNESSRQLRFRIDRNIAVPGESAAWRAFTSQESQTTDDGPDVEDLSLWCHSDGKPVGSGLVSMETRLAGDRVLALVQPHHQ